MHDLVRLRMETMERLLSSGSSRLEMEDLQGLISKSVGEEINNIITDDLFRFSDALDLVTVSLEYTSNLALLGFSWILIVG